MVRRWLAAGLAIAGCTAGDPVGEALDPSLPGPYTVSLVDGFQMDLGDRGSFPGVVPALLYVPEGIAEPPHVVLFNHGFAIAPTDYYATLVHLASWGLVVMAPTWDPGIPSARTHVELADDVIAALDWLQRNPLPVEFEVAVDRFGVGGHSRGGKQALLAATRDPRIAVTFNLDPVDAPPPFGSFDPADYPSVTPELMGDLSAHAGHVGAGRGGEGSPPCAPVDDNYAAYFAAMKPGAVQVVLDTAGHADFVDPCAEGEGGFACAACPAGDDPLRTRAVGQGMMAAFYRTWLDGDERFPTWADGGAVGGEVKQATP
ncbi:MAG TPA: hypothetical protein PKA64_15420 [Myxococcota bacterium]|nr:hypothetical protein [Myxococcota bacterium]